MIFSLQFQCIKKYVENGGSLLVLMSEGGETKSNTNLNFLLEEYGIMVNNGLSIILITDQTRQDSYLCNVVNSQRVSSDEKVG